MENIIHNVHKNKAKHTGNFNCNYLKLILYKVFRIITFNFNKNSIFECLLSFFLLKLWVNLPVNSVTNQWFHIDLITWYQTTYNAFFLSDLTT